MGLQNVLEGGQSEEGAVRLRCMYRTGPPSLVPSPSPLTASEVSTLGNQDVPQLVPEFPSLIDHSKNLI